LRFEARRALERPIKKISVSNVKP